MTQAQQVLVRIREGIALRKRGAVTDARHLFTSIWAHIEDGDPFARCLLAHSMADVQDDPDEELRWDLIALDTWNRITEARAAEQEVPGARMGLLPSLHLSLAYDYRRQGQRELADEHVELGRRYLHVLGADEYGELIRREFVQYDASNSN